MRVLWFCVLLFLVGCGGHYTGTVDPIKVDLTVRFNVDDLLAVFYAQCKRDLGSGASTDDLKSCASAHLADFLAMFESLFPSTTPSPTP